MAFSWICISTQKSGRLLYQLQWKSQYPTEKSVNASGHKCPVNRTIHTAFDENAKLAPESAWHLRICSLCALHIMRKTSYLFGFNSIVIHSKLSKPIIINIPHSRYEGDAIHEHYIFFSFLPRSNTFDGIVVDRNSHSTVKRNELLFPSD